MRRRRCDGGEAEVFLISISLVMTMDWVVSVVEMRHSWESRKVYFVGRTGGLFCSADEREVYSVDECGVEEAKSMLTPNHSYEEDSRYEVSRLSEMGRVWCCIRDINITLGQNVDEYGVQSKAVYSIFGLFFYRS